MQNGEDEEMWLARQQQEADFAQRQDAILMLQTSTEWKADCSRGIAEGMQSWAGAMQGGGGDDAQVASWLSAARAKHRAAEFWESKLQGLQAQAKELYHHQGFDVQATR